MIDEIEPRHDMYKDTTIPTLPTGNPLHVFRELALSIQRLAGLGFRDHLPHVHVELAAVLGEAVETV